MGCCSQQLRVVRHIMHIAQFDENLTHMNIIDKVRCYKMYGMYIYIPYTSVYCHLHITTHYYISIHVHVDISYVYIYT